MRNTMANRLHNQDQVFLKRTLKLAQNGQGHTLPNPMVGAMIVKKGKVVAQGYHKKAGLPHAELEALNSASSSVAGATLYVNMEPCCYSDKTPPCTKTIIQSKIDRVVCCTLDPNPKVNGKGIKQLRKAGINVHCGLLAKDARRLNEQFFTFQEKHRPFIAIKFAASLDGKIATRTGDSKWITNEEARKFSRKLRTQYQAVLVGVNTILSDNPHLGTRVEGEPNPLRIILDSKLRIPVESQVLRDEKTLLATTSQASKRKKRLLLEQGIEIITTRGRQVSLHALLKKLTKRKIISILVEGGGKILGEFLDKKLIDKVYAFHAPVLIGGNGAVSAIGGRGATLIKEAPILQDVKSQKIDGNYLTIGYPNFIRLRAENRRNARPL